MKIIGNLVITTPSTEGNNDEYEEITFDSSQLKMTVELEEYSKQQFKDDSTEYRTLHVLKSEYGDFVYETITAVSTSGTLISTELVNQPQNVEIIEDFVFSHEEDSEY